jgi:hypothetical protein
VATLIINAFVDEFPVNGTINSPRSKNLVFVESFDIVLVSDEKFDDAQKTGMFIRNKSLIMFVMLC